MPNWKKVIVSGSNATLNSVNVTTNVVAQSFTGSLQGTSSWAVNALTASYAINALTASYALTASFSQNAQTASYVLNAVSSSFASTASFVQNAVSSSFASTASFVANAQTASYVLNAVSASFASTASFIQNAVSSSFATSASNAAQAQNATSASFASTASFVVNAISASYAATSSNILGGDQYYVPFFNTNTTVSGSFLYQSGSLLKTTYGGIDNGIYLDFFNSVYKFGQFQSSNFVGLVVDVNSGITKIADPDYIGVFNGVGLVIDEDAASIKTKYGGQNWGLDFDFISRSFVFGDIDNSINGTKLIIDDINEIIKTTKQNDDVGLKLDFANNKYQLGNLTSPSSGSITVQNTRVDISKDTYITGSLTVSGITNVAKANVVTYDTATGQLYYQSTSSLNVTSASYAATASSADNFTVRGTLTAQTIVAQTITSSTDFVTGSTRFGSLLSNTHQFTGSVSITGSLTAIGNTNITGSLGVTSTVSASLIYQSPNTGNAFTSLASSGNTALVTISSTGATINMGRVGAVSLLANSTDGGIIMNDGAYLGVSSGTLRIGSNLAANNVVIGNFAGSTATINGNTTITGSLFVSSSNATQLQVGSNLLFVSSSSNVGISTTTPSYTLDINGTARVSGGELRLDNGTTGTLNIYSNTPTINFFSGGGYTFGRSSTTMTWNSGGSIVLQISSNSAYTLDATNGHIWRTATSGGAALARLTTGGNLIVGGTTDAGFRLDVNGTSRFSNNMLVTGSVTVGLSQIKTATVASSIVGANNLFTDSTGSFSGAKYLYTVTNGTNARTGEVLAIWAGGSVQYTDNSTLDLGSTTAVTASVSIVTAQAQFNVQTNTSGWTIKSQVTYL